MPFARYLQSDPSPPTDDDGHRHGLQFQIPAFMYSGAPTLAPGGGAEVLPFNSAWLTNTGFTNTYTPPSPAPPNAPLLSIAAPTPLGLPVYSASGFDVLSLLARLATRPSPRVVLGPVDMTCSFVVVDVRRHDHPIVYCSPSFCCLTGYAEHDILGRNCRFLQAPGGAVRRGDPRRFTSQHAVAALRKACAADKEVQTTIVNFRKDGTPFVNLVSVIPVPGGVAGGKHELNDVVYHVGFQVDLTEQPNLILEKLREGAYLPSQPSSSLFPPPHDQPLVHRKTYITPPLTISPFLSALLHSPSFLASLPISTATTAPPPLSASANPAPVPGTANSPLALLLLEYAPDFIHVVSLKGAFLYVAPAVERALGYTPSELVGRSLADLAHPEDVVPLERQLKESSVLLPPPSSSSTSSTASSSSPSALFDDPDGHTQTHAHAQPQQARTIDILFRARTKQGTYVWVECRGRLHVEPGKGRKAIILSGRARAMPWVAWGEIVRAAGGVALSRPRRGEEGQRERESESEFWVQVAGRGRAAGAMVGVTAGVRDVLGYTPEELVGRRIGAVVVEGGEGVREALGEDNIGVAEKRKGGEGQEEEEKEGKTKTKTTTVGAGMRTKTGAVVPVLMVFYRSAPGGALDAQAQAQQLHIAPAPVLVQIRLLDGDHTNNTNNTTNDSSGGGGAVGVAHPLDENVFAELEVSRGSSWQYELQQLRFTNRRLREEVAALEKEVAACEGEGREEAGDGGDGDDDPGETQEQEQEPGESAAVGRPEMEMEAPLPDALGAMGDVYPDMALGVGMSLGGGGGGGHGHANYTVALERYATATGLRGYGGPGTGTGTGLMPAPVGIPARAYQHPHQHLHQQQQQLPSLPLPLRAQTPARIPPGQQVHSQHRLSLSHHHQQQHQALYAPVPLRSSALMQALQHQQHPQHTHPYPHPHQQQQQQQRSFAHRAPSRMEPQYPPQMQAQLQSLRGLGPGLGLGPSLGQAQGVTVSPLETQTQTQAQREWGAHHGRQGVKRPLER